MSPPIFTPDGSEVSEIVLPDGSTASEVIGPDGNVVFEAGPDIPDSVVDSFEDQNITEYSGDTGAYSVFDSGSATTSPTPTDGTYMLEGSSGGNRDIIISTSGLNNYPTPGGEAEADIRFVSNSQTLASVLFGVQNSTDYYEVELDVGANAATLYKRSSGGDSTLGSASPSLTEREWYRVNFVWNADGLIDVTLTRRSDDTEVASFTGSDSTFSSGGVGWIIEHTGTGLRQAQFDRYFTT